MPPLVLQWHEDHGGSKTDGDYDPRSTRVVRLAPLPQRSGSFRHHSTGEGGLVAPEGTEAGEELVLVAPQVIL